MWYRSHTVVKTFFSKVRFHVVTAASMKTTALWAIAPYSLEVLQRLKMLTVSIIIVQWWRQYVPLKDWSIST